MRPVANGRARPWGAIALALAVLAWAGLLGGVLVFLSSMGTPGDGAQGLAAAHGGLMLALGVLVAGSAGSTIASVLAWRSGRGRASAAVAALLLGVLVLALGVPLLR